MTAALEAAGIAVLGVDPGRRWTAGVLRAGQRAVDGWTVGPVDEQGRPDAAAVDNVDDVAAWARYMRRVLDRVEGSVEAYQRAGGGPVHLAVEVIVPPMGRRIALADWLIPRQILAGLLAYDPGLVLIRAAGHGKRRPVQDHYPPEFWPAKPGGRGGRPATWGPNEARRGERDHERAAWDIAGAGAIEVARRARTADPGAGPGAGPGVGVVG